MRPSYSSRIIHEKKSAKSIPKYMNVDQQCATVEASRSICARFEELLKTRCNFGWKLGTFMQFRKKTATDGIGDLPRPKKFRIKKSAEKFLL